MRPWGGASVFSKDLARKAIIVLGSESHGISAEVLQVGGQAISVPGSGGSESLNVAMAAAALCTGGNFCNRNHGAKRLVPYGSIHMVE